MQNVLAKLNPPAGGKNWSFQTLSTSPEQRQKLLVTLQNKQVSACRPFHQGDSENWLMIEFWTSSMNDIQSAARILAAAIGAELKHGEFTREEALGK
jgi:hypothetical protein